MSMIFFYQIRCKSGELNFMETAVSVCGTNASFMWFGTRVAAKHTLDAGLLELIH